MKWEMVKLGDVALNLDSKRKPLNEQERRKISKQGLYPYIGANNIMGYVDEFLFDGEIICVAEDGGSWGANEKCANYYHEKCWVNNHAHVLGFNGKANLKYLMHYLNFADLNKVITGTTRGKLTKSALESIPIPLPPLATQHRIAEILDKADALRQKDQALLRKYDELAQSVFVDMFGDPVRNEKGWEVRKLKELVNNHDSQRVPVKESDRQKIHGEYPYYGATGIIDYVNEFIFNGKFLLIAEDGKNLLFRKRKNAFLAEGKFWVNNHAHILSFNGKVELSFLEFHLNQIDLKPYVTGIDQFKLTRSDLDRIAVFVPPLSLQTKFASISANIEMQKELIRLQKTESEALFGALLKKAFN